MTPVNHLKGNTMNIKKTFATISEKKIELRRKALILGGTAVGIIIAYTYLSKSNANYPDEIIIEETIEIIEEPTATDQ